MGWQSLKHVGQQGRVVGQQEWGGVVVLWQNCGHRGGVAVTVVGQRGGSG